MANQRLAELYLSYQARGGGWWKLVGGNLLEPVESSWAAYQADSLRLDRRTQHPSHREVRLSYEKKW